MFSVNDKVKWTSQSMGNHVKKVGTIVEVVQANSRFNVLPYLVGHSIMFTNPGWRDKVSYLVSVPPKAGSKARPKLYWPIATLLKKA